MSAAAGTRKSLDEYDWVCSNEADSWRKCVEANLGNTKTPALCEAYQHTFDKCIAAWRLEAGAALKLKGENEGDPPIQCAAFSCLVGECLRKTNYTFDRCKDPMNCFKHCVKGFFGNEYIQ